MFATFPNFSKLTLKDREEYEALIGDYPPLGDISFQNLMFWWDALGGLGVARLNGGLVVSYWIPGDEEHSGLSFIGTERVEESICTIFDYQRERGEQPRLVNVPEFVVNGMRYPELFAFRSGRGDDEYLITISKFAALEHMPQYMRYHARKFMRQVGKENIEVKNLDLRSTTNRQLLLEATACWPLKGVNDVNKLEREALPNTVRLGAALDVRCVGLYVHRSLEAFCLYFLSNDAKYAFIPHARVNYDLPNIFDYVVYAFCAFLVEDGVQQVNIHADNDSLKMRALKIALKPDNFFRKYTIEPI